MNQGVAQRPDQDETADGRRTRGARIGCAAVALISLVFLAWLGVQVRWALTATPGTSVDYMAIMEEEVERARPGNVGGYWEAIDDANAIMDSVRASFETRYGVVPDDAYAGLGYEWPFDLEALRDPDGRWLVDATPEERSLVLSRAREGYDALVEAGYFEALAPIKTATHAPIALEGGPRLMSILLPRLGEARRLARANATRMRQAAQAGDMDAVVEAFEQNESIARANTHQPVLICQLVGLAINHLNVMATTDLLADGLLDRASCRAMLGAMDRQPVADLSLGLRGERLFVADFVQATHTDDGRGSGRFLPHEFREQMGLLGASGGMERLPDGKIANLATFAFPSKRQTLARVDALYDEIEKAVGLAEHERADVNFALDRFEESLGWREPVLGVMIPAWGRAIGASDQALERRAALRLMLAIELHRREHGVLPASLDELGAILGQVPLNPRTGKAFNYRVLGEGQTPDVGPEYRVFGGYELAGEGGFIEPSVMNAVRVPEAEHEDGDTEPEDPGQE